MKKKIIISLVVIALLGAGAAWVYRYVNKPVQDVSGLDADYTMSPVGLLTAYEENEKTADSLYLGKVIQIHGRIMAIDTTTKVVSIDASSMMSSISCELSPESHDQIYHLKVGDSLAIKGECAGYLMDVILKRSAIE